MRGVVSSALRALHAPDTLTRPASFQPSRRDRHVRSRTEAWTEIESRVAPPVTLMTRQRRDAAEFSMDLIRTSRVSSSSLHRRRLRSASHCVRPEPREDLHEMAGPRRVQGVTRKNPRRAYAARSSEGALGMTTRSVGVTLPSVSSNTRRISDALGDRSPRNSRHNVEGDMPSRRAIARCVQPSARIHSDKGIPPLQTCPSNKFAAFSIARQARICRHIAYLAILSHVG